MSLLVFSCKNNDYNSELSRTIKSELSDSLNKYDLIILIPGSGCSGCITKAEDFFMNYIGDENIKFILTNNNSNKGLKIRLGNENIKRKNVLIDNKNTFYLKNFEERIYPMAISIIDNEIYKIQPLDELVDTLNQ